MTLLSVLLAYHQRVARSLMQLPERSSRVSIWFWNPLRRGRFFCIINLIVINRINDDNESWPGSGGINYKPVAKALKKVGYDGYVSVEVFDFKPDPKTIAQESMKSLKSIFG
jgi:hypothetical protein